MRHRLTILLTALTLSSCAAPHTPREDEPPQTLVTVPSTESAATLEQRYGGTVVLRTSRFTVIGTQGALGTQSALGSRNRRVMRAPQQVASAGTVGLWSTGTVGLWATGTVGLWSTGSYAPVPENSETWKRIGLDAAQQRMPALGRGVTIAVLDTGIDLTHPAFQGRLAPDRLWRDFVDGDRSPQDEGTFRQGAVGHGTEVAGIALQVAPNATILPLRVLDRDGSGDALNVARGIVYAADHGADVINLSLGSAERIPAVFEAVAYATERGVLVSAAAGNGGGRGLNYPAQDLRGRWGLSVGSVTPQDVKSSWSQYGSALNILAPGEQLFGPAPGGQLAAWSGTSMSAPVVSGALALGLAEQRRPTVVMTALLNTAQNVDQLTDNAAYKNELGEGRLDLQSYAAAIRS